MFSEFHTYNQNKPQGWIEIIVGCMFSGKTEELQRRIRRAQIAGQQVDIFKPKVDSRYSASAISTHNLQALKAQSVNTAREILALQKAPVVAIDEVQFFDADLVEVVQTLANNNVRVMLAGLSIDYKGNVFGSVPELLAKADFITKLHAICTQCGALANYSFRTDASAEQVLPGAANIYQAYCRTCYHAKIKHDE